MLNMFSLNAQKYGKLKSVKTQVPIGSSLNDQAIRQAKSQSRIAWSAIYLLSLLWMCCLGLALSPVKAHAEEQFLSSEQAFQFDVQSLTAQQAELKWKIHDQYYLYQHQFKVTQQHSNQTNPAQPLILQLPAAEDKHDAYFGDTKVYHREVAFQIKVKPNQHYQVTYQGCAEKGLCYPISRTEFETDQDGLVILADRLAQKRTQDHPFAAQRSVFDQTNTSDDQDKSDANASSQTVSTSQTQTDTLFQNAKPANTIIAQDQQWSTQLHTQSLLWSLILFLGLGCLLAFTPCSLPMLPILSSLLLRKHAGVRAWSISLVFVLSMASVYALLGVIAASAGNNFQRWLQQPIILISFSLIFITFALNLFGVFELKLPHKWSNRLDQLQARQQGGTLIGAALMGILSALLVGPCMTAPLAGTLLYISQIQNIWIGALLLFTLGLGMGIPLLLLTILGERALPKPGQWMNAIRHIFAFVMLGLSVYFIRPLLSDDWFHILAFILIVAFMIYLLVLSRAQTGKFRYLIIVILASTLALTAWAGINYWQDRQRQAEVWQIVSTKTAFEAELTKAKQLQQPIMIDVYADWCIACQPIERQVWTDPEVQKALQHITKIKIDLTRFDASQQNLLNDWQILGPPTVLFLDANAQEQRTLRLTGEFNRQDLLKRLAQISKN